MVIRGRRNHTHCRCISAATAIGWMRSSKNNKHHRCGFVLCSTIQTVPTGISAAGARCRLFHTDVTVRFLPKTAVRCHCPGTGCRCIARKSGRKRPSRASPSAKTGYFPFMSLRTMKRRKRNACRCSGFSITANSSGRKRRPGVWAAG